MPTTVIKTIRASGGDYTSLSAFFAALPADLVAADEQWQADIYNDWPSGLLDEVYFDGTNIPTDATRNIVLNVPESERHNGVPGSGFWMTNPNAYKYVLEVKWCNIEINGLDVQPRSYAGGISIFDCDAVVNNVLAKRNLNRNAIDFNATSKTIELRNSYLYGGNSRIGGFSCTNTVSNCLFDGFHGGAASSTTFHLRNCVLLSGSWGTSTFSPSSSNNASYDVTNQPPPGASPYSVDVVSSDFVDLAANDVHLSPASGLINQGINLYSDFTKDIDGDDWPSSGPWNIGFDTIAAAGGSADLTAAAKTTSTTVAAFTADIPLFAAASAVAKNQGVLSSALNISGTAASVSVATSFVEATLSLTVSALNNSLVAAGLDLLAPLAAQTASQATLDATLNTLSQAAPLSGSAQGHTTTDSEITLNATLSGTALAKLLTQAVLSTGQGLSAQVSADAAASAIMAVDVPLSGVAKSHVKGVAGLSAMLPVSGSGAVVSNALGGLNVSATLSVAALSGALVQAGISADSIKGLIGSGQSKTDADATLNLKIPLSAAAMMHSDTIAVLTRGGSVTAAGRNTVTACRRGYTATANHRNYTAWAA